VGGADLAAQAIERADEVGISTAAAADVLADERLQVG
jgi:hypothetical protein